MTQDAARATRYIKLIITIVALLAAIFGPAVTFAWSVEKRMAIVESNLVMVLRDLQYRTLVDQAKASDEPLTPDTRVQLKDQAQRWAVERVPNVMQRSE